MENRRDPPSENLGEEAIRQVGVRSAGLPDSEGLGPVELGVPWHRNRGDRS